MGEMQAEAKPKTTIESTIPIILEKVEKNEKLMPLVFVIALLLPLLVASAPINALIGLGIIFAFGYLSLKYIFNLPNLESSIFGLFFSFVFFSVTFRAGLLFSNSATAGFLGVIISLAALVVIRKFRADLFQQKIFIQKDRAKFWIAAILICFTSLMTYIPISGNVDTQELFWNGADANWQTSELSHIIKNGIFSINPTTCQGNTNYELDSYTSTVSLIPPYMIMFFGNVNATTGHQIMNYIGFAIMGLGVLLVFSRLFTIEGGFFAALFVVLPFVTQPYLPEFYGIWRLTLFNYIFPWVVFLIFEGISSFSAVSFMSLGLMFLVTIQPFNTILLAPIIAIMASKDIRINLPKYILIGLLIGVYFYFAFYQVVFEAVGNAGKDYTISISAENNKKIESDPLLTGDYKLSYKNLGTKTLLLIGITTAFLLMVNRKNYLNFQSEEIAFLVLFIVSLIIASGFVYLGDTLNQYILKSRYTFLLLMAFPIAGVIVSELRKVNKVVFFAVILLLGSNAAYNVEWFKTSKINDPNTENNPTYDMVKWVQSQNWSEEQYAMYFEQHLPQNLQLHIPIRHIKFQADKKLVDSMTREDLIHEEELWNCKFIRENPLVVKEQLPIPKRVEPQYIISSKSQEGTQRTKFNELLLTNQYQIIYSNSQFVIFKKET